jgi:hypothetical protein
VQFHARTFLPGAEDKDGDHWRFVKLYGDKNGRLLRYGSFNVRVAHCHFLESYWLGSDPFKDRQLLRVQQILFTDILARCNSTFWTIIMVGSFKSKDHPFMARHQSSYEFVLDEMIRNIYEVLKRVEFCWRQISDHLTSLISENAHFMEDDEYVKLLFEDESYTRSRTYWVASASLKLRSEIL